MPGALAAGTKEFNMFFFLCSRGLARSHLLLLGFVCIAWIRSRYRPAVCSGCGYATLGDAVNSGILADGDVVEVATGTYEEAAQLDLSVSGITLQYELPSPFFCPCSRVNQWYAPS